MHFGPNHLSRFCITLLATLLMTACGEVNDDRIPAVSVNLDLSNQGYWDLYGVHGLGQYRYFIRNAGIPANFPYTALSYTGLGGILLVTDISNNPLAYDLACPVEVDPDVRVVFDTDNLRARCPSCGSVYDVCEYEGSPVSGPAHDNKYALRRYRVIPATTGGYNIVF